MGQDARLNFVICTANDADSSLEILIVVQSCHIVHFLSTCGAKRASKNACKLNLIRFEFAHEKNFVLAYFLSPRLLSKRMHLVRWVSELVVTCTVPSRMFVLTSNTRLIVFRRRVVLNLQEYRVTLALCYSRKRSRDTYNGLSSAFYRVRAIFHKGLPECAKRIATTAIVSAKL